MPESWKTVLFCENQRAKTASNFTFSPKNELLLKPKEANALPIQKDFIPSPLDTLGDRNVADLTKMVENQNYAKTASRLRQQVVF